MVAIELFAQSMRIAMSCKARSVELSRYLILSSSFAEKCRPCDLRIIHLLELGLWGLPIPRYNVQRVAGEARRTPFSRVAVSIEEIRRVSETSNKVGFEE